MKGGDMLIDLVKDYLDGVNDSGRADLDRLAERIEVLKDRRADCEADGLDFGEEGARELKMLVAFYAEVERVTRDDFAYATIVPEDTFDQHVRYQAEIEYSVGPDSMGDYVDWERYGRDQRKEFTELVLDDQTVWVK
jgi:hypothetical protein